jgi:hypothetical protein
MTQQTAAALVTNLEAAFRRALDHRKTSRTIIRLHLTEEGLKVMANVPARSNRELYMAIRLVPWHELSDRHGELTRLVDDVAVEVDRHIGAVGH